VAGEKDAAPPKWQQLELLVAAIQKELAPGATVRHDVKLPGTQSETERQIDVLIEQNIGQYTMRIVIDCKDYATPADVKAVEAFQGLIQDVGAHRGALVCPAGFTRTAKKRARKLLIDLYSPVDTDPHKWQTKLALHVLCDFRGTLMSFGLSCSAPMPLRIPQAVHTIPVFGDDGTPLGTIMGAATARWNAGEFPTEPGEHQHIPIFSRSPVFIDNGYGARVPVELTVSLTVTRKMYLGKLPISRIRGLRDEQTGAVITNAFTTGHLIPAEVEKEWQRIEEGQELPFRPVMTIVGLDCWGVEE
jgi:hypothetical protein